MLGKQKLEVAIRTLMWKLNCTVGTQAKIGPLVFGSVEVRCEFLDSIILTFQGTRAASLNMPAEANVKGQHLNSVKNS